MKFQPLFIWTALSTPLCVKRIRELEMVSALVVLDGSFDT